MSGNEGADAVNMEARATARLLGMNVTLLLCFFFSRLLLVVSTRIDNYQKRYNYSQTEEDLAERYSKLIQTYWTAFMKFGIGISKAIGFPAGLLLQILTVIFLVRGSTGFSLSARKWFLLVVSADIAGTLYRAYEMITDDFYTSSPYLFSGPDVVSERLAAMLFHIPYFTNSLFIAGLSRSFYQFLFPCIGDSKPKLTSSDSHRTF
uniref:ABC transmembrane type-1 domain-containing protein n=1 Tax=Macrostomum lignano TaxID=282301 RepID=A0A1I8J461_9PLAT